MSINMHNLTVGNDYERPVLAELWGYKNWHAFGRGIFTPKGEKSIVLFITKEKQGTMPQYQDEFSDNLFFIEGENNHQSDGKVANASKNGDHLFLFYRDKHHSPFKYFGEVYLVDFEINSEIPSKFILCNSISDVEIINNIITEKKTHGVIDDKFEPEFEGRKKISLHVSYERSIKNRQKALQIHGTKCLICGFDFNDFYGKELANSYIEIHHVKSLSLEETLVNPLTDLIPVCSNCHSMLHKNKNNVMSPEELKNRIKRKIA